MGFWGERTNEFQFGRQLIGGLQQAIGYSVIICKLFELSLEWYILFSVISLIATWFSGWVAKEFGLFASFMKSQFKDVIKTD
jgi:hypothetical protein